MKIAIASDASGFRLKEHVKQVLREAGHDVTDVGQQREDETVRYYEAGELLARAIQSGAYERGFVMCGSGAGVCMTAGKFRGVYAVACESEYTAAELRRITNANVMAMGEKVVTPAVAGRMALAFVDSDWCDGMTPDKAGMVHEGFARNGAFAAKPGTNCKLFVTCREMLGKPARGIYNESKEARRAVTQGGRLPILL